MGNTILLLIVICIIVFRILLRNPSYKGRAGENRVSYILSKLPDQYLVIDNIIIPTQRGTTQIDHAVVSPFGVFVIETKNYSGWIFGAEASEEWKETFRTTEGSFFRNPIKQNWGHIYALSEYLNLDKRVFKSIIVFSDEASLNVTASTPVIYMSELRNCILSYNQEIIPQKLVVSIYNRIIKTNLVGKDVEKQHIQSVKQKINEKDYAIEHGICPRCGGELVLRKGRYGKFYGCSNYPQCKFTYNP